MRPIVCAIDDSDVAESVVRTAQELTRALGGELVLLHVAPPTEAPGISAAPAGQERLREAERADAHAFLEGLAARLGVGDARLRTEVGSAAGRIVEICREEDAHYVVVGSRGRGDLASAVLGSVSNSVASRAPCPVVVVPPQAGPTHE